MRRAVRHRDAIDFAKPEIERVRARLTARWGPRVDPWWEGLPAEVARLASEWSLTIDEPVGQGNTSLVLAGHLLDGHRAMLKLTPDPDLARAEANALLAWQATERVPGVWASDPSRGALLIEAVADETPLSERDDAAVTVSQIADLIGTLHRGSAPERAPQFASLSDRVQFIFDHWIDRYGRCPAVTDAVPGERLRRGYELASALAADKVAQVLLHGDLHPGNVLDGGRARGLVAIDPRPCIGDASFDVIDWVFWRTRSGQEWRSRNQELAEALGYDRSRIWGWCRAFAAVLAAGKAARGKSANEIKELLSIAP